MLPTPLKPCLHRSTAWPHNKSVYKPSPALLWKRPSGSELHSPPLLTGSTCPNTYRGRWHQGGPRRHCPPRWLHTAHSSESGYLVIKTFLLGGWVLLVRGGASVFPRAQSSSSFCSPDLSHKGSSLEPWLPKHTRAHLGSPILYLLSMAFLGHGHLPNSPAPPRVHLFAVCTEPSSSSREFVVLRMIFGVLWAPGRHPSTTACASPDLSKLGKESYRTAFDMCLP